MATHLLLLCRQPLRHGGVAQEPVRLRVHAEPAGPVLPPAHDAAERKGGYRPGRSPATGAGAPLQALRRRYGFLFGSFIDHLCGISLVPKWECSGICLLNCFCLLLWSRDGP